MTNTIENKQRFFDAYSGQKIFRYSWNEELYTNRYLDQEKLHKYTAELKPLSKISDEDAIEVAKILGYGLYKSGMIFYGKRFIEYFEKKRTAHGYEIRQIFIAIDYLRSKSYLLPFMDLTIEQILEYGWAVLKSK